VISIRSFGFKKRGGLKPIPTPAGVPVAITSPGYSPSAAALIVIRPQFCLEHHLICAKVGYGIVLASDFMHDHPKATLTILKNSLVPSIKRYWRVRKFKSKKMMVRPPVLSAQ
jgi:hypothetical protein